MNATAVISAEIQVSDIPIFEALFKRMKAKKIIIKSKEDDTEMTKEAFFDKVDRARKGKMIHMSREEMKKLMFD